MAGLVPAICAPAIERDGPPTDPARMAGARPAMTGWTSHDARRSFIPTRIGCGRVRTRNDILPAIPAHFAAAPAHFAGAPRNDMDSYRMSLNLYWAGLSSATPSPRFQQRR
jgi:hypothetical protein